MSHLTLHVLIYSKLIWHFPQALSITQVLVELGKFTVRAANLPSSQIGVIEVPFRGRVLKIAGDRTFEPWTITVQNDSRFVLRSAFELWASSVQAYNENFTSAAGLGDADDSTGYFADMTVHQLARDVKDGDNLRSLSLTGSITYSQVQLLLSILTSATMTLLKNSQLNSRHNTGPQLMPLWMLDK